MLSTEKSFDLQVIKGDINHRIQHFFNTFSITSSARKSNIYKTKGCRASEIIYKLFILPFIHSNIYRETVINNPNDIKKDVVYDFTKTPTFSWRGFLLRIVVLVYDFINSLTSNTRDSVLIFDDSPFKRGRTKKAELLSLLYDHSTGHYYTGYRLLCLAWSDGHSILPVDFSLLGTPHKDKLLCGVTANLDSRTNGARRRQEAVKKIPDLLKNMVKRALNAGIEAKYLVFDSWYALPSTISSLREHINIIGMVKKTKNIHYQYNGEYLNILEIYKRIMNCNKKSSTSYEAIVKLKDDTPVKLAFIKNKNKPTEWVALISTNSRISAEKILQIYAKRWDIEVMFRTLKHELKIEKMSQARNFDAIITSVTISLLQYIFLSYQHRISTDNRTIGLIFHSCVEEVKDYTILDAYRLIFSNIKKIISQYNIPESVQQLIINELVKSMSSLETTFNKILSRNKLNISSLYGAA